MKKTLFLFLIFLSSLFSSSQNELIKKAFLEDEFNQKFSYKLSISEFLTNEKLQFGIIETTAYEIRRNHSELFLLLNKKNIYDIYLVISGDYYNFINEQFVEKSKKEFNSQSKISNDAYIEQIIKLNEKEITNTKLPAKVTLFCKKFSSSNLDCIFLDVYEKFIIELLKSNENLEKEIKAYLAQNQYSDAKLQTKKQKLAFMEKVKEDILICDNPQIIKLVNQEYKRFFALNYPNEPALLKIIEIANYRLSKFKIISLDKKIKF